MTFDKLVFTPLHEGYPMEAPKKCPCCDRQTEFFKVWGKNAQLKLPNGHSVSVSRGRSTYGSNSGKYEIQITYPSGLDEIIGHCDEAEVERIISDIE